MQQYKLCKYNRSWQGAPTTWEAVLPANVSSHTCRIIAELQYIKYITNYTLIKKN